MSKERTLEVIKQEIAQALDEVHKTSKIHYEAAQKHEALVDEYDDVRVASFNQSLVARAIENGVNPRNFETEDQLKSALEASPRNAA